jgi:hypothetical protein
MASNYELDANPKDRAEILQRDRELRDAVSQMTPGERRTQIEFLQEITGYSKAHIYKCLKPDADPSSKEFRSFFGYGKSKVPQGLDIPKGVTPQDAMFNLKLRIGETVVRGVESGGAKTKVSIGTKNGESTRDFGNTISGIDTGLIGRYLLDNKFMKNNLEPRLFFQPGGGVYFEYWHDSPNSSGEQSFDSETLEDYAAQGLIDPNEGWY